MAGTRRLRIDRPLRQRITPAALAAFRRLRVLETECTCLPDGPPIRLCAACDQWWAQQSIIHRELALKPWHFPAVEYPGMGEWEPNAEALALWRAFEEAASEPEPRRGRRKRARRARAESENPNFWHSDLPSEPAA